MKKNLKKISISFVLLIILSSFSILIRSSQPPLGHTGAEGLYCNQCHNTNALNNAGGSVTVNGLPDTYIPGTTYNFSVTINHSAADRKRWGFSIVGKNGLGTSVGTFGSTNANATNNGDELSHLNAINFATLTQSYTYTNLSWTAPANPTANDASLTFYLAGAAANGNNGNSGDFIYATTKQITRQQNQTFTFTGTGNWSVAANWANNLIPPSTITNGQTIIIDPPANGECILNGPQTVSGGGSIIVNTGKKFRVNNNLTINN